jgi:hypothetical protein
MKRLILVAGLLLLVACESESSLSSELFPTPLATIQATEQTVGPSIIPPTIYKDLSVTLVPSKFGFKLEPEDKDGNFYVAQTLQAPNSPKVIQIMRKIDNDGTKEGRYRESAIVIHPDTQEIHIYSLMNAPITDGYSVDSVARVYGFIDDQRMVYVAVHGDDKTHKTTYSIDTLNIETGRMETLFANQPNDISQDFFTRGWLNEQHDTLVLSSYKGGQMWVFDLIHKTSRLLKGSYSNTWPLQAVQPAPNGNYFWFEDKLYDLYGKVIAKIDRGKGLTMHPAVQWRKDSQYMIFPYTLNEDSENILGGEDGIIIIAPQGIKLMNSVGKVVQKIEMSKISPWRVELIGWITGKDYAVLQYYQLQINAESPPIPTKLSYKLLNLVTGELTNLQQEKNIDQIVQRSWLLDSTQQQPFAVDLIHGRYWMFEQPITQLISSSANNPIWAHIDYETLVASLYQYSDKNQQMNKQLVEKTQIIELLSANKWIIDREMNYTLISNYAK